jgi:peptide/nickel transport system permease protein
MASYLLRRVLLFVPTIIGATFIVVMLMALAPTDPILEIVRQAEGLPPGVIEQRIAYIEERYGSLNTPAHIKYLRWLNKVSPIGLDTWKYDEPRVVEQRQRRRVWEAQERPGVTEQVRTDLAEEIARIDGDQLRTPGERSADTETLITRHVRSRMAELESQQGFWPMPGDIRWDETLRFSPLRRPPAIPFVKQPDLGDSIVKTRPVWPIIREALPVTLLLNFLSVPLALAVAMVTGIWSAKHRGKWQDWGTGGALLALYSVPVIWLGVMSIGFFANVQFMKWFPAGQLHDIQATDMPFWPTEWDGSSMSLADRYSANYSSKGFPAVVAGPVALFEWIGDLLWPSRPGYLLDTLWHLALPVFCLALGQFAFLSKLTRTAVLETLGSDYIRTAHAKGLAPNTVLLRHALRNSLIPVITFLAALIPYIVAGSIVVESIFSLNGMGRLTVDAIKAGDTELFLGVTLMILILKLICYLLADIAYVIADPRVSYSGSGH